MKHTIILSFFLLVETIIACKPTDKATTVVPETQNEEIKGVTVYKNLGMDVEFEKELIAQKIDKDGVVNDQLSVLNIDSVSSLQLDNTLTQHYKGIEVFKNLNTLIVESKNLKSINLNQNPKISILVLAALGQTTNTREFNINNLTNLKHLRLAIYGKTKGLDLEKISNLENLEIGGLWQYEENNSKILQLGNLSKLKTFSSDVPNFEDIVYPSNLEGLSLGRGSDAEEVDLSNLKSIKYLVLQNNFVKIKWSEDAKTSLIYLAIWGSKIKDLNLSGFKNLNQIELRYLSDLERVDVSGSSKIKVFHSFDNGLLKNICVNPNQVIDSTTYYPNNVNDKLRYWYKDNPSTQWGVCK